MNYIQIDVISLATGYICGVFLCWVLCEHIYGDNKHD
jgi:hypothetical protein